MMAHKRPAAAWCCLLVLIAIGSSCRVALATGRSVPPADEQMAAASSYERDYRDRDECRGDGNVCARAKQCCSGTCLQHTCWSNPHQRPPCREHSDPCWDSEDCCGALVCGQVGPHPHPICYLRKPAGDNGCVPACTSFDFTGGWQNYTVPAGVSSIRIDAYGAQGGSAQPPFAGGKGARMSGSFTVAPDDTLIILVGGEGEVFLFSGRDSGGGGGTFVVLNSTTSTDVIIDGPFAGTAVTPLVIAGGGGGVGGSAGANGWPGQTGQFGTNASAADPTGGGVPKTSGAGLGGDVSSDIFGSGGGGFRGNGTNDDGKAAGTGGRAFLFGGAGGVAGAGCQGTSEDVTIGGFGGGGGGGCGGGAGGGGGYSGGDGGRVAGGAGSFNAGTDRLNIPGDRSGNGTVSICVVC